MIDLAALALRQQFVRIANQLADQLHQEALVIGRRVPEDGSSPGVNYRRAHARRMLDQASHQLHHSLDLIGMADSAVLEAQPKVAA